MIPYRPVVWIVACALLLAWGWLREVAAEDEEREEQEETVIEGDRLYSAEVATVGMDRLTGAPVVLLRAVESGHVVPIWIGLNEAQAIVRVLQGLEVPRPMTHDLMASLLDAGELEVKEIVVQDLRDGTYYGAVYLTRDGQEAVEVDSRPSDALALALRVDAPIRMAGKVIEDSGDFQFVPPSEEEQVVKLIGLTLVAPTDAQREELGLGDREGVLIEEATKIVQSQGLQEGDVILEVEGEAVRSPADVLELIQGVRPGDQLEITYWRDGEEETVTISVFPEEDRQAI